MVDYMSSVQLVETGWSHSVWMVLYPGKVYEVDPTVSDVVTLLDLVKDLLE